jgi:hypothetical protein
VRARLLISGLCLSVVTMIGVLATPVAAQASSGGGCYTGHNAGWSIGACISAHNRVVYPDMYVNTVGRGSGNGCTIYWALIRDPNIIKSGYVGCVVGHYIFPSATGGGTYYLHILVEASDGTLPLGESSPLLFN